jgi:hypothetical protein
MIRYVTPSRAISLSSARVKKDEKAIRIIAPLPVKARDRVGDEETGETRMLFKTVFVFDRAQVAPIEGVQ